MIKKNKLIVEEMPDGAPVAQPKAPRDKRESFTRLAERRTNRALKDIRSMIPLANKSAYDYDATDSATIIDALKGALADLARAFEGQKQERPMFTLHAARESVANSSNGTEQS